MALKIPSVAPTFQGGLEPKNRFDVLTWRYVTSRHVTSRHVASRRVASRRVASRHVASRRVASRHVTSRHVASRRVTSYAVRCTLYAVRCAFRSNPLPSHPLPLIPSHLSHPTYPIPLIPSHPTPLILSHSIPSYFIVVMIDMPVLGSIITTQYFPLFVGNVPQAVLREALPKYMVPQPLSVVSADPKAVTVPGAVVVNPLAPQGVPEAEFPPLVLEAVVVNPLAPAASGPYEFRDKEEDEHECNPVVPYTPLYSTPAEPSPYVVGTPLPRFTPVPSGITLTPVDKLLALADAKDAGTITQAEFAAQSVQVRAHVRASPTRHGDGRPYTCTFLFLFSRCTVARCSKGSPILASATLPACGHLPLIC